MTFTKEQLIARARFLIKRYEDSLANYPDQDGVAMDLELARMALAGMKAEPVAFVKSGYALCYYRPPSEYGLKIGDKLYTAPQPLTTSERAELENYRNAQQVVPGDITGPLEHAYKELTPQFMRNHISVFERYGTLVDGLTGIQAMRIALDVMERRADMLHGGR